MDDRRSLAGGRYLLEGEPIGSGGMGTVWRGYDTKLRREVAVKELHMPDGLSREERDSLQARAIHEARAIARLDHPGIVAVYDVLEEDGRPWIVMRLVTGGSLDQKVKEKGPLTPRQAADVGVQILEALTAAHHEGVLHLDVKPQNVLLDGKGRVVLTDFGIALIADATKTLNHTRSLIGTVGYVAPERLADAEPGPAADLWSLGATLYFAVEGRPAYGAGSVGAIVAAVMSRDPDPTTRAGTLAPVISGLLARDVAERLDAADASARLRAVAADESDSETPTVPLDGLGATMPLPTEPLAPPERTMRFTDRTSMRKTMAVVVAVIVLVGVLVATPFLISPGRGNDAGRPGVSESPSRSPSPSSSPSPSPSPTDSLR